MNQTKVISIILSAALLSVSVMCGCEQKENTLSSTESAVSETVSANTDNEESVDVFAMDTYMNIKAYGTNAKQELKKCSDEIQRLDALFNVTDSQSDIYQINARAGSVVEVSQDTAEVIQKAKDISAQTDGALDISIYPVLREWGFTAGKYKVPDEQTIENLLQFVDYRNINVNGTKVNIPEAYAIDLGSVAKGYTSDRLYHILKDDGITSALINLGGNVQTLGTKPDGSKWTVGIQNPQDLSSYICTLKVSDLAVITSGNYERYFEEDGKKYWHIMDTRTGKPADNGIISATVIGKSGIECDALSTALFAMGTDKAKEYCQNHKDIEAVLIDKDMTIYITEGLVDMITMTDGLEYSLIERN